jgi:hypothetical protein
MQIPWPRYATSSVNEPFKTETLSDWKQQQPRLARMKIESGRPVGPASGPRKAQGAAAPGFTVATDASPKAAATSATSAVASLDAILALQTDDPVAQRRRRQARRGRDALDALEELERGLLLGRAAGGLKARLETLHAESELTGESGLDAVLLEIDIRLAVEAAKLERV